MTPHSAILSRINPAAHHKLRDDAELTELGLCTVDLWGVACDLEAAHGFEFPPMTAETWRTVGDVVASLERKAA